MWFLYRVGLLALCIWREARSEGREGMRAVAHVVRNRMLRGRYGGTVEGNIAARAQFSSMSLPSDPQIALWPAEPDASFATAVAVALAVLSGVDTDNTQGSTEYCNPALVTSDSFRQAVASGELVPTVRIGNHQFYRRRADAAHVSEDILGG